MEPANQFVLLGSLVSSLRKAQTIFPIRFGFGFLFRSLCLSLSIHIRIPFWGQLILIVSLILRALKQARATSQMPITEHQQFALELGARFGDTKFRPLLFT